MNRLYRFFGVASVAIAVLVPGGTFAQGVDVVHGESSEFANPTLKLLWAVRRGTSDDATQVVIRAVNVTRAYTRVRVDGVDPFTKERVVLVAPRSFGAQVDLNIARAKFAAHPSTEIHLFRSDDDERANRPALTVFYLGVPDTTPEFGETTRMEEHLANMAAKTKPR